MRIRTTIASAALLSFGAGAASAASVTKSIDVDAPPAKVWAMIGPFCSISAWHPAIGKCTTDGNAEPTRTLVTIDGKATFVEIETARDEKGMSYSYLLVSGFPVYRPGRVDQESMIEAMRRYGGDLQNILRKRSQVFG